MSRNSILSTVSTIAATLTIAAAAGPSVVRAVEQHNVVPVKPTPTATATATATPQTDQVSLIERARPGVVQIVGREVSGSGFVIDAEKGLIATNSHVAEGLSSGFDVRLSDGSEVPGRVVAKAPCDDLAVVQITPPSDLIALEFGSSSAVKAGQQVTALGFPTSLEEGDEQVKATTGMVSAVNVVSSIGPSSPEYLSTINHQAAISPGSSGGPLLDAQGKVIGVNTLGNSGERGEVQGQYYAISSDEAQSVLEELSTGTSRTDIGLTLLHTSELPFEEWYGENEQGARDDLAAGGLEDALYIAAVEPGSAADDAGLEEGMIITDIEGAPAYEVSDVCGALESSQSGDQLEMDVVAFDVPDVDVFTEYTADVVVP